MNQQILRQMIDFNKKTFDNSFNTIFMLQEQTERTVHMFLEHAIWPNEEGKKVLRDWVKAYNKGCDDFKKLVDENFKHVDAFFADVKKTEAVKPEAAKPEAVKPEAVKPEAVKPEAAKPEAVKPEAVKPEAAKPEAMKPEAMKPEAMKPEAVKPEIKKTDVKKARKTKTK